MVRDTRCPDCGGEMTEWPHGFVCPFCFPVRIPEGQTRVGGYL